MAMNSAQTSAFTTSTGGYSPNDLLVAVSMVLAVIYLLWTAWIAYSQFKAWQTGQGTFYDLIFTVVRTAIISLLVGYTFN